MVEVEIKNTALNKIGQRAVWIYNREIKTIKGDVESGSIAVLTYRGKELAIGFVNPKSKITFRVIEFYPLKNSDIEQIIERRIEKAIRKRDQIKNTNSVRLIHSEADGLPGLIVDRYGKNIICSFDTAGMDRLKALVVDKLIKSVKPNGIFEKANKVREKEGLPVEDKLLYGNIDDEFIVEENGRLFKAVLKGSQKTGFYLDQRKNRQIASMYGNRRTLDLFSFSGGFGIYAKAEYTKFVDVSEKAIKLVEKNCALNGIENYDTVKMDVFKFLESEKERYDLIIIDPPAFAKNKNALKGAINGLKFITINALRLLEQNGHIAIFSCSNAIGFEQLLQVVKTSSQKVECELELISFLKQDVDHPFLINIPSSLYLTGLLLKKV